jgi:hypothetical protein
MPHTYLFPVVKMDEYINSNPERIMLRGDELPCLLLGSAFLNLRNVGKICADNGVPIEFYQQRGGPRDYHTRSRFFIGRDSTQQRPEDNIDYRIELCQCMPEMRKAMFYSQEEIRELGNSSFQRREHPNSWSGDVALTTPSFRVYRYDTVPPFTEEFITETHDSRAPNALAYIMIRFARYRNRDFPERIRALTSFMDRW